MTTRDRQIYPVVFIDAIVVKVRNGQVTNKAFYVAIGVTTAGERDNLGIWAGQGGKGAKSWQGVLTEIKNRRVADVFIGCCDGLKGLPEAIANTLELATVQTCVIHLLRNTYRHAPARTGRDQAAGDLRPVFTALTVAAARLRFTEFKTTWGVKYLATIALWDNAWNESIPFLDWDVEIRKIVCTTNAIESINAPTGTLYGPGGTSQRGRRPKVPLSCDPVAGPQEPKQGTMGHPMEGSTQRLRHHLRRTPHLDGDQLTIPPPTVNLKLPGVVVAAGQAWRWPN